MRTASYSSSCGLPRWLSGKDSACQCRNAGDMGLIPRLWYPVKEEMEAHSNILAWKIPWTEEPDRLQSMGAQRVRHDWAIESIIICNCNCAWLIKQAVPNADSQSVHSKCWMDIWRRIEILNKKINVTMPSDTLRFGGLNSKLESMVKKL